jgi:hypothetical protein
MSPSESDLRAALHDGEGRGGLNVNSLIAHAEAVAAQRRARLMSGAAIVAVVLGTGVGIGYLAGHGSTESGSSSNAGAGTAMQPNTPAHSDRRYGAVGGGAANGSAADVAQAPCPKRFPQYELPGGGGLNSFGANGPLFTKPVASIVVCAYGDHRARLDLRGRQATALAASLENAPKATHSAPCAGGPSTEQLAILPIALNGSRAPTVTVTFPTCGSMATNGTAVRYDWTPPSTIRRLLSW